MNAFRYIHYPLRKTIHFIKKTKSFLCSITMHIFKYLSSRRGKSFTKNNMFPFHILSSFALAYDCMCKNLFCFLLRNSLTRNVVTSNLVRKYIRKKRTNLILKEKLPWKHVWWLGTIYNFKKLGRCKHLFFFYY